MESLKLRDRDAILTEEGLIFRVYGYCHPPEAYVCDVEYSPNSIFTSADPRAFRSNGNQTYYKFYTDEGLQFVREKYPRYTIFYKPLKEFLVGVKLQDICKVRKPDKHLQKLTQREPGDNLLKMLNEVLDLITCRSGLEYKNFGVFGSLLHGVYHPEFSDIDLVVYGRKELEKLRETLRIFYSEGDSPLKNEFANVEAIQGKHWHFANYTLEEYMWHQKRKMIYGLVRDSKNGRSIKVEFEPVKSCNKIYNEYSPDVRIKRKGWTAIKAVVTEDGESPFIPSIYTIDPIEILDGPKVDNLQRVLSYVEEFRMQARTGEEIYLQGNLEEVTTSDSSFHQITLTYGPRYYEQVLKTTITSGVSSKDHD